MQPSPPKKLNYITNKELLLEIHRSKNSYCEFIDPKFSEYHAIVDAVHKITPEFAERVIVKRNSKPRRGGAVIAMLNDVEEVVFRVMTHSHVPLCDDKKRRSRSVDGQGHLRVNFPPFKHYVLRDGEPIEVGRSHWKGPFDGDGFSPERGRISNRLAQMFMMLADRYSRRNNWRGYSYVDEMRSNALLQLSQVGLQFNEAKGDNPFAFYTTTVRNCFLRIANVEKRAQLIRDDMLIMSGAAPSYTRQIEDELGAKFAHQAPTTPPPAKRGRKAKSASITEDTIDEEY